MDFRRIHHLFTNIGGEFRLPLALLYEKLNKSKAFIFDWDGVFNNGAKGQGMSSLFSEPDAMGTNLLRLGFWLKNGQQQPYIGILTALNNESAQQLAEREHFNTVFADFKNKKRALDYICQKYNLQPEEIVFFFDDVLDLSVAESIGVSIMIRRDASPLFVEYVREKNLCHYITGNTGSTHAVREACELILGMTNMYDQTVSKRMSYDEEYQQYWKERNAQNTAFFTPSTIE